MICKLFNKVRKMKLIAIILSLTTMCMNGVVQADSNLPPTVEQPTSTQHPAIPSGLKVTCFSNANDISNLSSTCPVIKWNGYTYWAYSYIDNRVSLGVVAYDLTGKVAQQWQVNGVRYVYKIEVDSTAKKITFYGQSNQTGSLTFSQITLASQLGNAVVSGQTLTTENMTNTFPKVPADIYRTSGTKGATQADLATFSWLEFIALVAPVGSLRGGPGGSFANSGADQDATLVWETYLHRSELFPFNINGGQIPPQPWDNVPQYLMKRPKVEGSEDMVAYTSPYSEYNNLDETSQISQNIIFFPTDPGDPKPQTDPQIVFEAKVNYNQWAFVNENYKSFAPKFNQFRFDPPLDFPDNTLEVKAAWRPLSSIPTAEQYKYHTTTGIVYGGEEYAPEAKTEKLALIALHIIQKTENYPTFIFATFEHEDNLTNKAFQPPNFSSSIERSFAGRTINYSSIKLNGQTQEGNTVQVAPGSSVSVSLNWASTYTSTYCPGCLQQFYIGVKDEAIDCMYSGQTAIAKNGSGSFNLTAPTEPGIYAVQAASSLQYSCTKKASGISDSQAGALGFINVVAADDNGTGLYYLPAYTSPKYTLPAQSPSYTSGNDGSGKYNNQVPLPVTSTVNFDISNPMAAPNGNLYTLPLPAPATVADIAGAKTIVISDSENVVAVPVTQPATVSNNVAKVNQQALEAMKNISGFNKDFVWQYYKLKGVQGVPTNDESSEDFFLANNVVESSQPTIQLFRGGGPNPGENTRNQTNLIDPKQGNSQFAMGGCQGCHGVAQTGTGSDFSFLFFGVNGGGFQVDTLGIQSAEEMQRMHDSYTGE